MKVFFEGAFLALSSCAFTRYFFNIFMSKSIFLLRIFSFKKTRENAAVHKKNDRYSFITISLWYLLWCATFSVYFLAFINMCIDLLYLVHQIKILILSFMIGHLIGWTRYYRSGFLRRPQKFDEISWLIWRFKLTLRFRQIFVAFLENLDFNISSQKTIFCCNLTVFFLQF